MFVGQAIRLPRFLGTASTKSIFQSKDEPEIELSFQWSMSLKSTRVLGALLLRDSHFYSHFRFRSEVTIGPSRRWISVLESWSGCTPAGRSSGYGGPPPAGRITVQQFPTIR